MAARSATNGKIIHGLTATLSTREPYGEAEWCQTQTPRH
jgi:hypothetical protein